MAVKDVGLTFFVVGTISRVNRQEACMFIEPPRRLVALENPQTHRWCRQFQRLVQERRTNALTLEIRQEIEVLQHIAVHRGTTDDRAVDVGQPYLLIRQDDRLHPPAVFIWCMKLWQPRHRRLARDAMDPGKVCRVFGDGWSKLHRIFACLSRSIAAPIVTPIHTDIASRIGP